LSRIKLAMVTQFPRDPAKPHGGVEAVSVNLAHALSRLDEVEVHVVTLDASLSSATRENWGNAVLHRLPRGAGSELGYATGRGRAQVHAALAELDPDVVHAHDTYGLMVKGAALPRVFTIHGFIYGDTLVSGQKFPWLRSKIWKRVETGGWADQPNIISISPYVRERLAGIGAPVIYDIDNPISADFFDLRRAERPGVVFCAAAICPRKNQIKLVQAVAALAKRGVEVELRLAGGVTDARYGEQMQHEIARLGVKDKVRMLGQIGTPEVMRQLQESAVFALVSLEENSPMGIEEAMAARVPVLTSNRCGMPYMVGHGETGYLVDPFEVADIERRLGRLLGDAGLRAAMGDRAHAVAQARFHPERVARRTLEVYRESLERADAKVS
jgi:glycosyltransferase involved in cell wall biosynthesis